jgi:hypothetical protein
MHPVDVNLLGGIMASVAVQVGHGTPRSAYIDPGTGSLLLQAAIAGIVTVPFVLRRKIAAGFDALTGRGRKSKKSDPTRGKGGGIFRSR